MPMKKRHAQLLFQRTDACRDVRLNRIENDRCLGDVANPRNRFEYPEIRRIHLMFS
jgi:hypothetical protein